MLNAGFYNMNCMDAMKEFPDGFFDLAIVDPPYGGGVTNPDDGSGGVNRKDYTRKSPLLPQTRDSEIKAACLSVTVKAERRGGAWARKYLTNGGIFDSDIRSWDIAPSPEYFAELARVSKNQIIWGGNYFSLPPTRCFLVWRKLTISESFSMAMCEYAWTSFNENAKIFECTPQGTAAEPRIHPTQKPVKLYQWILGLFAKPGMKILDTHAGSGSSLIACARMGFEAWGFEIDEQYYKLAAERIARELSQGTLF